MSAFTSTPTVRTIAPGTTMITSFIPGQAQAAASIIPNGTAHTDELVQVQRLREGVARALGAEPGLRPVCGVAAHFTDLNSPATATPDPSGD